MSQNLNNTEAAFFGNVIIIKGLYQLASKVIQRSIRLPLPGKKRSVGIAVNDGLLRIIPNDFDIIKINELNQITRDIAIHELGKEFSARGNDRPRH